MAMASSMEDEVQKRNTDCVYFLASPLTCKKGSECEYRHSESARLNPRDCWYWLSGNCLNPTCAFRHPPLEGLTEPPSDLAYLQPDSIAPTSKTNVPCYFYFNAFCVKGDQCPFLHGHTDILPARKFLKASSEVTCAQPQENKRDMEPASVNVPTNPSEGTSREITNQFFSKDVQKRAPSNTLDESSPSPGLAMLDYEEPVVKLSDEPHSTVDYIDARDNSGLGQSSDELVKDQSSDELLKDHSEPEERWESSPGFDVLVDDESEQLAYEDDTDYLLVRERESERLHNHLIQYDYEGSARYDSTDYKDHRILYDHGLYDSYDKLDDGYTPDHVRRIPEYPRERVLEPMFPRKRRLLSRERDVDRRDRMDLRDHLRIRRRTDVHQVPRSSQKRRSSHSKGSIRERQVRHGMDRPHHGRFPSELGKNMIGSLHSENESTLNGNHRSHRPGYSQFPRHTHSRQWEIESRREWDMLPSVLPLEILRGVVSKDAKRARASTIGFTGPKTLAQIKEEKETAREDRNGFRNSTPQLPRKDTDNGFQGPRPLSELLKDKRKPVSEKSFSNGHFSEFPDDDDDDDGNDIFAKKLEGIFIPA